jgi:hypothetical protein
LGEGHSHSKFKVQNSKILTGGGGIEEKISCHWSIVQGIRQWGMQIIS